MMSGCCPDALITFFPNAISIQGTTSISVRTLDIINQGKAFEVQVSDNGQIPEKLRNLYTYINVDGFEQLPK